jgi:hypothetical protein
VEDALCLSGSVIGAAWNWKSKGSCAIIETWRLDFHIDDGANSLQRGMIAGGIDSVNTQTGHVESLLDYSYRYFR